VFWLDDQAVIRKSSTTPPSNIVTMDTLMVKTDVMVEDASHLYAGGRMLRYPDPPRPLIVALAKDGSGQRVLREGGVNPGLLALDATRLYWADDGTIYSMLKDGTDVRTLGKFEGLSTITVGEQEIYFIAAGALFRLAK
jgi:hypothetical protein